MNKEEIIKQIEEYELKAKDYEANKTKYKRQEHLINAKVRGEMYKCQ